MHRFGMLISVVVCLLVSWGNPVTAAYDDLPRTFVGCVAQGGNVRNVDGEITCRLTRSYHWGVHATGTTECGEEVHLEDRGQTRTGVVTYPFEPSMTALLPDAGDEMPDWSGTTFPCLQEPDEDGE